jgi:hypothetical protein
MFMFKHELIYALAVPIISAGVIGALLAAFG